MRKALISVAMALAFLCIALPVDPLNHGVFSHPV